MRKKCFEIIRKLSFIIYEPFTLWIALRNAIACFSSLNLSIIFGNKGLNGRINRSRYYTHRFPPPLAGNGDQWGSSAQRDCSNEGMIRGRLAWRQGGSSFLPIRIQSPSEKKWRAARVSPFQFSSSPSKTIVAMKRRIRHLISSNISNERSWGGRCNNR